ncbi:Peptidase M16 inactive domain protein [Aquisphaera giovannonii]|uniref:Peptidase M16 inactive domain protein n=1 Tax=Aquisphaera giovannonii TaxID=406548 RepID=A0A5B9WA76_9BACT|nr:pitrilysin family protein [Aquisphaera giovannonii]QEH36991.1 Peptidase M16 inactive domain protein [Aquisphaera giovannonii]
MQLPDLDFRKHTLANGLDVILRAQGGLPFVAVNLWYHVGSKNEERNQRGYAHLFEHLMFEGSQHYPGDFFKHLQRLGASINGSTSSDRTNYFVDIPTAHLETVLAMESDRMACLVPALDENRLRIQKGVVKNEYRQNYANRPYGMVWPLIAEAMYPPQHPYSWMTIGVMEDLDAATLGDVSAFFARYYVPANSSLAIVGDIDPDAALSTAERYFGPIPAGSKAQAPWTPATPLPSGRELVLRDRVELDRLYLLWHTVPHFHEDDAPLGLLGDILARGKASRLYNKLVIDRQIAQDVTAYQSGRELAGAFGITVTLRPSRAIDELRGLLDEEVASIAEAGVTPEELSRVRTMKTASFLFALEHLGGFGGVADRLNAYNVYRGDPGLITRDLPRFQAVDVDDIRRVARRYLAGKPAVSLSVVGQKAVTSSPTLDRAVPPTSSPPAAFAAPTPEILRLGNGLPVWVIPRRDLPTVSMAVAMIGGASLQPSRRAGLAQLAVSMLDEGTRTRSAAEIALAAEAMGTGLSASCGWDGAFVSFRCLEPLVEPSLDLAADILREPSFPEAEWDRLHGQTLAALRADRDSAEARGYRALLAALYDEGHPYHDPLDGTEEIVAGLRRDEAIDFHRRVLGPAHAGVVVAGDVDPDRIVSLLERRLGDWAGPPIPSPVIDAPSPSSRPRLILLDRPGAAQAVIRAGHVGIARNEPDFEALLLANQVLGGQFTSRLNEKLREEKAYTYGVRSSFDCRLGVGPFSVATSVQSDKAADAIDDIMNELRALVGDRPPTQAELDDARRSLIEGQTRQFETPAALVNRYANLFVHSLPPDHFRDFAARLQEVSLGSLADAARRRIRPDSLVVVVVADAAQVQDDLKRLGWAELELLKD